MNTFGSSGLQFPLYDPREPRESRSRFRRERLEDLDKANSFYCPVGRWPAYGWILLARRDLDQLNTYSTNLTLHISNTAKPDNVQALNGLSIVQAKCVTRGLASDPNALYLVKITDGRGILANEWFQFPTSSIYNIRTPAYPETFMRSSMNSGVPVTTTWTWTTMLQNLWEQMGTFLGDWPGLPFAPAGTPEGFWFPGVSAWSSLNDVLDHLGMTIVCDLTQDNPYTIVRNDATDDVFTALQTRYKTNLEDDLEWIDVGAARIPGSVKVFFRRRNGVYGTEETYRYDSFQWNMTPFYTVTVNAPASYSNAVGTHFMWSDYTVRYDENNSPLAADVTMANSIAQERVTQYYASIDPNSFISQTYAGALPFKTGSMVDGVAWVQTNLSWHGWRTKIVSGPCPPFAGIWG